MVDISRPWVVDSPLSTRFPVYTRANVGEVSPEVATPLFWSMIGGPPTERQWKRALADFGAFDLEEFREDEIDIQGMIHGYVYLNLSNLRVFGVRMPSASAELMDRTYLGEREAPTYVPHPDDARAQFQERILATVARVFADENRDDFQEDARKAAALRAARPDLGELSDADLLARQRRIMAEDYAPILRKHLTMVYESSLVTGALAEVLAPFGDATMAVRLMGGFGEVASAAPSQATWELGRQVVASTTLTEMFEQGLHGLEERLRSSDEPSVVTFVEGFDAFLYEYGSRSANEWEAAPKTWETHPGLPLGMIDRMRLQAPEREPRLQTLRLREEREELTEQLRTKLAGDGGAQAKFDSTLRSIAVYMPARELSKTNAIRVLHEARLPMWELGMRYTLRGFFGRPEDITMLREGELDALIEDPAAMRPVIQERWEWYEALSDLEPPFIIDGEIPDVRTWPRKTEPDVTPAEPGEVLQGIGACFGVVTGRARIIEDPEDAPDLEPGEILVAPLTDPGWTPLFSSAGAVVVNVGSTLSHAAIVARELGIPAVLGVRHATKKITDGTILTVDGAHGTVLVH
ncbi:phosphoenolpyruvate-utilizing protein [Streptomyces sp. NWU339]|uniref:PEP-utilizing enzyme n=1 Tax=Streptomyces sp. NWU339 TaxID=2185284 RepID=UPI000D683947|nr:PEP-utilizing enzyme [Streptomyces sp. NWU339]PWI10398.1 phosphoenolpyruvate-utilizing protein [Streptomyces sp. NWU339]